jgi:hypothetical protein
MLKATPPEFFAAAKKPSNPTLLWLKNFLHTLITFGFGYSIIKSREERKEKEATRIAIELISGLSGDSQSINNDPDIFVSYRHNYKITIERDSSSNAYQLCTYQGKTIDNWFRSRGREFVPDQSSRSVQAIFTSQGEMGDFVNRLINECTQTKTFWPAYLKKYIEIDNRSKLPEEQFKLVHVQGENYLIKSPSGKTYHINPELTMVAIIEELSSSEKMDNSTSGSFKKVLPPDSNGDITPKTVVLVPTPNNRKSVRADLEVVPSILKYHFTSVEIAKIITKYNIGCFIPSLQFATIRLKRKYMELNISEFAGQKNLQSYLEHDTQAKISPKAFKKILNELQILHQNNYFHLDLKPANITIKHTEAGDNELYVIDLDSLGTKDKVPDVIGTRGYQWYKKQEEAAANQYALQLADEYAMALTILNASGIGVDAAIKNQNRDNIDTWPTQLGKELDLWIETNIKAEYEGQFRQLVTQPREYLADLNNRQEPVYLAEMFGDVIKPVQIEYGIITAEVYNSI